jgi:hypothetical protein
MSDTTSLTIAIDRAVLREARIRALRQGTTVNSLLRRYLEDFAATDGALDRAVDSILAGARKSKASSGGKRWTRDELHD